MSDYLRRKRERERERENKTPQAAKIFFLPEILRLQQTAPYSQTSSGDCPKDLEQASEQGSGGNNNSAIVGVFVVLSYILAEKIFRVRTPLPIED